MKFWNKVDGSTRFPWDTFILHGLFENIFQLYRGIKIFTSEGQQPGSLSYARQISPGKCIRRFAGFGAAKHLAEQGYRVTLLDGAENPGGLSAGWRTPQGRAVEAGIKGFWYQVIHFHLARQHLPQM